MSDLVTALPDIQELQLCLSALPIEDIDPFMWSKTISRDDKPTGFVCQACL